MGLELEQVPEKNKRDITEWPVFGMLAGLMAIQMAQPLRLSIIISLGTWLIAGSAVLSFFITIRYRRWEIRKFISVLALFGVVFISIVVSFDFTAQNLVAGLCFMEIPMIVGSYPEIKQKYTKRAIYGCYLVLSVYYIFLSFTWRAYIFSTRYGDVEMPFLTLGYNNPNETAMHLFSCFIILCTLLRELKRIIFKILVLADIVALECLIIPTLSRTVVVMSAVFILGYLLYRRRRLPRFSRIVILIVPFVFLGFTLWGGNLMGNLYLFGETVETGRNEIYSLVLEELDALSFLVGDFQFRFQNLHNGFWSIFATIGSMGLVAFISLLNTSLRQAQQKLTAEGGDKIAMVGLFLLIVYTSTEAAFLTAGSVFAVEVSTIYLLSVSGGCIWWPGENKGEKTQIEGTEIQ